MNSLVKFKYPTAILLPLTFMFLFSVISCEAPVPPQGWALVYGVSDYGGSGQSPDLRYTDDDATAIAELLERKGWDVRLRLNNDPGSEASLARLKTDIEELSAVIKQNHRLLFYYSGHGVFMDLSGGEPAAASDNYDEVLLLYDSIDTFYDFNNGTATAADVLSTTVSDDSLAKMLLSLPASNRIVILDNCFAGGFIGDGFTKDTIPSNYTKYKVSSAFQPAEAFKLYLAGPPADADMPYGSFSVLAASGESEESFESLEIKHGYFTHYLLKTPASADYNADGYISLTEAYKFTADSIDYEFNTGSDKYDYMPHVSAFPVDPVLFSAD